MSDLRIENTIFEDLKKTFATISDRMDAARRALSGTDGSVVGESNLVENLHDFSDDWGYGVKQLGRHTDNAVKMIDKIGQTFQRGGPEAGGVPQADEAAEGGGLRDATSGVPEHRL